MKVTVKPRTTAMFIVGALFCSLAVTGQVSPAHETKAAATERPATFRLLEATIDDIHAAFQSGQLTCRELVERYLKRIDAYNKTGPRLNAVQTINPHALAEADRLDALFQSTGLVGPLHGIPVLVKDQVETEDMPTTYGSVLFQDFGPEQDATIVQRLKKAGAVILGKATMGEFGGRYASTAAGIVRNAYDPSRNPSGSSSGTGAGIAANFASVGIGEDTGGSIRGPAAAGCLVGLRPTVPLVSRHGMLPDSPSCDTLGPMTRTVKDAAVVLDCIAGYDPRDPVTARSVGHVPPSYTTFLSKDALKGARIGVIRQPTDGDTDTKSEDYQKVKEVIDQALLDLKRLGADVVDPVEISALNDRLRRAYKENKFETEAAVNDYLARHAKAPVKSLRELILSGKVLPSKVRGMLDDVGRSTDEPGYLRVLLARKELQLAVLKLMADQQLDALVYATSDHQPTKITPDVLTSSRPQDDFGRGDNSKLSSALGFPAITVPAGFTSDGLPVGIEFLARPFAEGTLIGLAYAYEQGTLHRRPPATTPALTDAP